MELEKDNPLLGLAVPPLGQIDALRLARQLTNSGMAQGHAQEIARFLHEAANPDRGEDIRLSDLLSMQQAVSEAMRALETHQEAQWLAIRLELVRIYTQHRDMQRGIRRRLSRLQWVVFVLAVLVFIQLVQPLVMPIETINMWLENLGTAPDTLGGAG